MASAINDGAPSTLRIVPGSVRPAKMLNGELLFGVLFSSAVPEYHSITQHFSGSQVVTGQPVPHLQIFVARSVFQLMASIMR